MKEGGYDLIWKRLRLPITIIFTVGVVFYFLLVHRGNIDEFKEEIEQSGWTIVEEVELGKDHAFNQRQMLKKPYHLKLDENHYLHVYKFISEPFANIAEMNFKRQTQFADMHAHMTYITSNNMFIIYEHRIEEYDKDLHSFLMNY